MTNIYNNSKQNLGFQTITGLSTAKSLTVPKGTSFALITTEGQGARWRDDATAPTSTIGYPLPVGGELRYTAASLSQLQIIEQAPSATVTVLYYGSKA